MAVRAQFLAIARRPPAAHRPCVCAQAAARRRASSRRRPTATPPARSTHRRPGCASAMARPCPAGTRTETSPAHPPAIPACAARKTQAENGRPVAKLRPSPNDTLSRTSASHSRAPVHRTRTDAHRVLFRNPRPPKTRLWISFSSSADAGRGPPSRTARSQRRASFSVLAAPSPWRIVGVDADVRRRDLRIGRVPERRRDLLAARPALEAVAVGRALVNRFAARGKPRCWSRRRSGPCAPW